jgi:hypothetical protein
MANLGEIERLLSEPYPPDKRSILYNSLALIIPEIVTRAKRKNDSATYVWQAKQIVDKLDNGIHGQDWAWGDEEPRDKSGKPDRILWLHQKQPPRLNIGPLFFKGSAKEKYSLEKELIESAAKDYLSYEWHSEYLDWVIVDVLVFWEWRTYLNGRNGIASSIIAKRFALAFYAVLFGIVYEALWWLDWARLPSLPGWSTTTWLLAVLAYFFVDGRWLALFSSRRPLRGMARGYGALQGDVLSPVRVREELQAAEKDGVVWPGMIWPVLDRVISRNATVWKCWR